MASPSRTIYWDSCAFVSYINEHPDRVATLEALLADETVIIYTSDLSRVEVGFGMEEQTGHSLDSTTEEQIDSLWTDPNIKTLEFNRRIATMARKLIRDGLPQGWKLKPMDAIHLATAQVLHQATGESIEFHTYDDKLLRYSPKTGYVICRPNAPQTRML